MADSYTAFRRCRVPVNCGKCGKLIPKGSPNFDYNTRDRSTGKFHNDCSRPAGWNAKQNRIELDSEWQNADTSITTVAAFNGICHICKRPTVVGITPITTCNDGINWRHPYCIDTTKSPESNDSFTTDIGSHASEEKKPIFKPEETKTVKNDTIEVKDNGITVKPINPITAMIWEEIKPLVAQIESQSGDVASQYAKLAELIDALTEAQGKLTKAINERAIEELHIVRLDESKAIIDSPHPSLAKIITLASLRFNIYLYGPAGSGKSTGAEQVAKAFELEFYSISLNRQSTPSLIVGYNNAYGKYVETDFFKAYTQGGVYLIDEMDNASGNLLTTLNSALANGHMGFPCGKFTKHKDFICIATGNTSGRGADRMFNERQQLDAATLDRFKRVPWGYDEASELTWALAKNPEAESWVKNVQKLRANTARLNIRLAVTPRASIDGAIMLRAGFTWAEIEELTIWGGLDADTIAKVKGEK